MTTLSVSNDTTKNEFNPISYNKTPLAVGMAVYQINNTKTDLVLLEGKIIELLPDKKMIKLQNVMNSPSGRITANNTWETLPHQVHTNVMELLTEWLQSLYQEAHWNLPKKIQRLEGYIGATMNKGAISTTSQSELKDELI